MKMRAYINLVLLVSMNYGVMAKQEFTNFEVKKRGEHLAGFIKCVELGGTDIFGFQDASPQKSPGLPLHVYWSLRDKKKLSLVRGQSETYTVCSRNADALEAFVSSAQEEERQVLNELGCKLKLNRLNVFSKNESGESINLTNQKIDLADDETDLSIGALFSITMFAVDVYDASVSDLEIGYVALKMLRAGKNHEIANDRYGIKMTVIDYEHFSRGLAPWSSFFVQKNKK